MLTKKIVDSICDAIYYRRLPPGTKLNEREIGELFGVSRSVVRQALTRLAQDGLIEISPKRSAVVWRPTLDDAYELYQAILVLESGVIQQLVKTITPEQVKQLRAHTRKEKTAFNQSKHDLGDKLARQFHMLLVSFLGNDAIDQIHAQLRRREALITAMFRVGFDYCQLRDEHGCLVDC